MPDVVDSRSVHAPHVPLEDYYRDEQGRRPFVRRIFDQAAGDYDLIERLMALGSGTRYRRKALVRAGLRPGMDVLDVATGTGLVAREAVAVLGDPRKVVGLDPSSGMLRARSAGIDPLAVQGTAESLPFDAASFDFLSMGFALRHMADLTAVFSEFRRVLRPGGIACILEITQPKGRIAHALAKFYMRDLASLAAKAFARHAETARLMRYYWDTIEACVPPDQVMATLSGAGFTDVGRHVELGVFSEYTARVPA
jgi:demethylmenaquinone methyltransferase/2-methoxy-6-polyprenyl-1,4-benzoquinol methylase